MPRFSANLTFLWPELDPYDRCQAAADAGFKAVEILFPHEMDLDRLERALTSAGVELVLFDAPPGEKGERGMLCLPGREEDCLAAVRQALELAKRFGTRRINLLAGMLPPNLPRSQALEAAAATLRRAGDLVDKTGMKLLIENISPAVAEGYFASIVEESAELLAAASHPSTGMQLDQYHVTMMGGDAVAAVERYADSIGHVQIADVPGRHQPGTGQAPISAFLARLDEVGYDGYVGLEYVPQGSMDEALAWLPRAQRSYADGERKGYVRHP
ncbi:MAG: hydroxypyruvate isomerase family protein [Chloroflexota bacterium]